MPGTRPFSELRILVVDDETPLRDLLREILELKGAVVDDAGSIAEARQIVGRTESEGTTHHATLIDLSLDRDDDGVGLAGWIRQRRPDARIVACTGRGDHPVFDNPKAMGFTAALAKPFLLHELVSVMEAAIGPGGCASGEGNATMARGESS